ncbi:MAG: phosphorylase kinase, partial [Cyanobacteriota bacterium]
IPITAAAFHRDPEAFLELGRQLQSGLLEAVPVQLAPLQELMSQASWVDLPPQAVAACDLGPSQQTLLPAATSQQPLTARQEQELEDIPVGSLAERLWHSHSLEEQAEVLELLGRRLGPHARLQGPMTGTPVQLMSLLQEVYKRGLAEADWNVVRRPPRAQGLVHPQREAARTHQRVRP